MTESKSKDIHLPNAWRKQKHGDDYIEWVYTPDESVFVRLQHVHNEGYSLAMITGTNQCGEEFVATTLSQLSRSNAFEMASTLIYTANAAYEQAKQNTENAAPQLER